jgi:hypothetical protein
MNANIVARTLRVRGRIVGCVQRTTMPMRWCVSRTILLALPATILLSGCGGYEPAPPPPAPPEVVETPPPPPQKEPEPVLKKAEVGVGAKGHGYGSGPIATPASVFFRARERLSFDIQIPQAMNLYKATEGHAPQSHEEFMEKIIKYNHIPLPELLPGYRYLYDPKQEQLMVEQPGQ